MTKVPKYTWQHCSVCGRKVGKKAGVQVALGLLCDDPICEYQGVPNPDQQRNSFIVAGILAKIGVSQIAFSSGVSRQRVYQIFDSWRKGGS